mmetsp:Transcript_167/g.308  ORF Transcript_167/g.308 Transcript_167/m.308 type:complete len:251 (-) Transcript_167:765-1517(-)
MMKNQESQELDVKTEFIYHPNKFNKKCSNRVLKPNLRSGVSPDLPDEFKLSQVPVLNSQIRAQELACTVPSRSPLLTQNKRTFDYQDYNISNNANAFDISSMKPSHINDLLNDKRPDVRMKSPFYSNYLKHLETGGFARTRGICTVYANQPYTIKRTDQQVAKALKITPKTKLVPIKLKQPSQLTLSASIKEFKNSFAFSKQNMKRFLQKPSHKSQPKLKTQTVESGSEDIQKFEKMLETSKIANSLLQY